jgi:hypothetical protein
MSFGDLSTWNSGFGDSAACPDQFYGGPLGNAPGTDYRGNPVSIAAYSFQEGYADPYGANIFQRIFTPRKWEAEKRGETGESWEEGSARLFSRGTSKAERRELRKSTRSLRKIKREARKQKKAASEFRVVRGTGGYVYRQRGDGCFQIIKSPRKSGSRSSGKLICPGDTYHDAINAEVSADYGPFRTKATAADWMQVARGGVGITGDIFKMFRKPTPGAPSDPYDQGEPTAMAGQIPKPLIYGAVGVAGLLLVLSMMKR